MIVNTTTTVAAAVTKVFGELYARHFPIEEMRVTTPAELTAPPTGDGNNTSAFVCRPTRGQTTWSAHAYGLAVDLNPFCNPYVNGNLVLPELASTYLDHASRNRLELGRVLERPKDRMHFSATGH